MRRSTTAGIAAIIGLTAWSPAIAQAGAGVYGASPYNVLRYRAVSRARITAPPVTMPAIPFDAKPRKVIKPGPQVAKQSTLPDAGLRANPRIDSRSGTRVGTAFALRLGGGPDVVPIDDFDPRDRLESKRANYDRPQ